MVNTRYIAFPLIAILGYFFGDISIWDISLVVSACFGLNIFFKEPRNGKTN